MCVREGVREREREGGRGGVNVQIWMCDREKDGWACA